MPPYDVPDDLCVLAPVLAPCREVGPDSGAPADEGRATPGGRTGDTSAPTPRSRVVVRGAGETRAPLSLRWAEPGAAPPAAPGWADPFQLASVVGRACGLDVHVIDRKDAPPALVARAETEGLAV